MNLLNWFTRIPSYDSDTVLSDVIWLTKLAKFNGISQAISHSIADPNGPDAIIVVAHFRDCLDELQKIVSNASESKPVTVVNAESLRNAKVIGDFHTIQIVVGERHLLMSHDEVVLEFANSLPYRCIIVHHVSIEDPIMHAFAGEWIENVLKRFEISEEEFIESKMVAPRFRAAQKKIGGQCLRDLPADSAEAWMELNCPTMRPKGQW